MDQAILDEARERGIRRMERLREMLAEGEITKAAFDKEYSALMAFCFPELKL